MSTSKISEVYKKANIYLESNKQLDVNSELLLNADIKPQIYSFLDRQNGLAFIVEAMYKYFISEDKDLDIELQDNIDRYKYYPDMRKDLADIESNAERELYTIEFQSRIYSFIRDLINGERLSFKGYAVNTIMYLYRLSEKLYKDLFFIEPDEMFEQLKGLNNINDIKVDIFTIENFYKEHIFKFNNNISANSTNYDLNKQEILKIFKEIDALNTDKLAKYIISNLVLVQNNYGIMSKITADTKYIYSIKELPNDDIVTEKNMLEYTNNQVKKLTDNF